MNWVIKIAFPISNSAVKIPIPFPIVITAFDAPALPDPLVRISNPRIRAMKYAGFMQPVKYPARIQKIPYIIVSIPISMFIIYLIYL